MPLAVINKSFFTNEILAYEDQQLKRSSGDNSVNIVPIQGATITTSVL